MSGYRRIVSEAEFEQAKAIVLERAEHGPFDASDVLVDLSFAWHQAGKTINAQDAITLVRDMVDLDYLVELDGTDPPVWQLPSRPLT